MTISTHNRSRWTKPWILLAGTLLLGACAEYGAPTVTPNQNVTAVCPAFPWPSDEQITTMTAAIGQHPELGQWWVSIVKLGMKLDACRGTELPPLETSSPQPSASAPPSSGSSN